MATFSVKIFFRTFFFFFFKTVAPNPVACAGHILFSFVVHFFFLPMGGRFLFYEFDKFP